MSFYSVEPQQAARACVIWMHGLGADASDMEGLAQQLPNKTIPLRHVFMNAPQRRVTLNAGMMMPAWYDILGMELADRVDKEGITHSEALIRNVMQTQLDQGMAYEQLFLAGFSQGGAMALHTALNTNARLGGVIALSAYLPLGTETLLNLDKKTPFFMAAGQFDPLVLPKWTQQSKDLCLAHGYEQLSYHEYPMEHSVCWEELIDLDRWLGKQIQGENG